MHSLCFTVDSQQDLPGHKTFTRRGCTTHQKRQSMLDGGPEQEGSTPCHHCQSQQSLITPAGKPRNRQVALNCSIIDPDTPPPRNNPHSHEAPQQPPPSAEQQELPPHCCCLCPPTIRLSCSSRPHSSSPQQLRLQLQDLTEHHSRGGRQPKTKLLSAAKESVTSSPPKAPPCQHPLDASGGHGGAHLPLLHTSHCQ
jgi:hypothetical protein